MIETLFEIEQYFGRVESALPKSQLGATFGEEALCMALANGWVREFQYPCQGRCESLCWLTKEGRNQAQKGLSS